MNGKKIKIGFLCGDIKDAYSRSLINGAFTAAEDFDINLVIVPGNYYGTDSFHDKYEYQSNALYSFQNSQNLDAVVILSGAIGPFSDDPMARNYFQRFADKFKGLPVVSVAKCSEGWSSIKYDNASAIKEGISYLVKEQQCKIIAMITGEKDSEDAMERLTAYKEGLLENDIEIDESLIAYGDFTYRSKALIKEFIQSHRGVDAIVFGNDGMAKMGYEAMEELGLEVGTDIAFLGFDDVEDAVKMRPPLASVRADAMELGYEAVKLAMKSCQLRVLRQVELPTKLLVRESMMRKRSLDQTSAEVLNNFEITTTVELFAKSQEIFDFLFDRRDISVNREELLKVYEPMVKSCASLFTKESLNEKDFYHFRQNIIDFLEVGCRYNMDASKLIRMMDQVMKRLLENQADETGRLEVSKMTARMFRRMVEAYDNKNNTESERKLHTYHVSNYITKSMFVFASGTEQNYRSILENLHLMGIKHSFLFLFKQPVINLISDDFATPEYLYLKAVQNRQNIYVPAHSKQKIKVDDMYQACIDESGEERMDLTLLDLYCDAEQYGILVCDIPFAQYEYAEQIVFQASMAIRMLSLLRNEQEVKEKLESSLNLLKKNNIELDHLSNRDELTGIYNRRGFYKASQNILGDSSNKGRLVLVIYADTDNLKIINDRYGHDEGDFAITTCSQALTDVLGKNSVVGRLGGDEFAAIVIADKVDASNEYKQSLEHYIDDINEKSDKTYLVRMSVGIAVLKYKKNMEIKDLLEKADALLYKEKMARKKEIGKQDIEKTPKE